MTYMRIKEIVPEGGEYRITMVEYWKFLWWKGDEKERVFVGDSTVYRELTNGFRRPGTWMEAYLSDKVAEYKYREKISAGR